MDYTFLMELAVILFMSKLFGLLMKKIGLPQVVGMLIAGILLSAAIWSPMTGGAFIPIREDNATLKIIAELGVILIMFSAGLETDINELKSNGVRATVIALFGVAVPMGLGIGIAVPFLGAGENIMSCVFIGTILTATSVSITVETLREMGKLKSGVGMTVLSAAIIDDVIGIVILSFVIGIKTGSTGEPIWLTIVKILLFFEASIIAGIGIKGLFNWLEKKYPTHRRTPVFGLIVCLIFAYCAERFFSIADITGAYMAGIVLSMTKESSYIDRKIDTSSYLFFAPVFFVSIGLKIDFSGFDTNLVLFALCFILAGLLGKMIGCGGAAKLCGFNLKDSCKIGVGMFARGEVALIVAQKGIGAGILPSQYLAPVLMLVIVSSLLAPILLKALYKKEFNTPLAKTAAK